MVSMQIRFVCWLIIITLEEQVFNGIIQRQWSFTLGQQILVTVRHIITCNAYINETDDEEQVDDVINVNIMK